MFRRITKNEKLGKEREARARGYIEKCLKWRVEKSNMAIDKYHAIDFICYNKFDELVFVQVKGTTMFNRKPEQKAVDYAIKHDAFLYYIYLPKNTSQQPLMKKIWLDKRENE